MAGNILTYERPWGQRKPPYGTRVNRKDPIGKSVVGCWLLNEGAGGMAYDASGYGNHGALQALSTGGTKWKNSSRGACVDIAAASLTDGKVSGLNTRLPAGASDPFTICYWHRTRTYVALSVDFGFGAALPLDPGGENRYSLQFNNHYYLWGSNADWDTGVPYLADSNWHFVVFCSDGMNLYLHLDGVLVSQRGGLPYFQLSGNYTGFGSGHPSAASAPDAQYSTGTILNRALTNAEVQRLYADPYCYLEPRTLWLPSGGAVTPPPSTIVQRRIPGPTRVGSRRAA